MNEYQILIIVIPPLAGVFGFLIKFIIERRTDNKLKLNKHLLDRVQFKLREFYQPILTNLIREDSIYQHFINISELDSTINNKMKLELDKDILDIHIETQKLIQLHLIDINPSDELLAQLVQYDKHVLIFSLLRKYKKEESASNLKFPGNYGIAYPSNLKEFISNKVKELRQKQNRLVGNWKEYSEPY